MKKVILSFSLLIGSFFIFNFAFWQFEQLDPCVWTQLNSCCCPTNWALSERCQKWWYNDISSCPWWDQQQWDWGCDPSKVYRITKTLTWCCPGVVDENWNCDTSLENLWITMNTECLLNWQCSLNVYKVMWIRKSNEKPTVLWFFQDIVLAATTFVWTVVVIALIVSGLIFAFGSITWKDTKKAKTIMIDCLVWLLLVMWSYTIIRLIQFIATAWS